jgi:hypothetical protein
VSSYHLAEVQRTTRAGDEAVRYFAACDYCGWAGPQRDTKGAAEDDAVAHDNTENGDGS